ncbi:MAG: M20/M25/M40 family metallo-hydrolase [Chloroflexi bacterium]|nr:M20/M25/M40 family metallo-hydrolase [Chloroflexota bacterium]
MPTAPAIDWDALYEEAIDTLSRFIQVDTSNPPGRERAACDFLGEILTRAGIGYETYDAGGDDRVSLRAVLPGDGSARPFMLLNHTDVVPVQREYWDVEPFAGLVKDGHIWGRGALDTKGLGIAQLMTFLLVKRNNIRLARDLVFYAMADEEAGGQWGVEWLEKHHPDTLDAEYIINEGGGGVTELFGVERPVFNVAVGEKGPLWVRLVAEGRPGHASVPHDDNALDRLVRAMYKIQSWQREMAVSPVLSEYFSRLKRANVYQGEATVDGLRVAAEKDPRVRAMLMNTISATTTGAGIKHNVIPARAEATLDCRLLPGVRPDDFQKEIERVVDDPKVKVERVFAGWSETNEFNTELFGVIEDVVREHVEDAVVVPGITVGFTDSRTLRNRGQISYGFSGGLTDPELSKTVHGHNERIPIDSLKLMCRTLFEVTRRMCEAR